MPSLCFIPKCCHGDTSLGHRDAGSGLLAGDIARGAAAACPLGTLGPKSLIPESCGLPGRLPSWPHGCFGPTAARARPSPENLCGHSPQASSWKGKEGCIILGKAYLSHLPRSTSFPSLSPTPAPSPSLLPSSFTLSGGFSIVCAFFFCLSPFFLVKTGLSLWVEKGSVFVECSCISKVLCWPVMNLPLLMWGNREML